MSDGAKLLLGSSTAGSAGGNGGQALLLVALPDRRSLPCGLCGPVGPVGCVGLWACGLYKVCPFPPLMVLHPRLVMLTLVFFHLKIASSPV